MLNRLECEPMIIEAVETVGCKLYALFLTPGKSQHLTILIDKENGATIDDCETVSNQIRFTCALSHDYLKNKAIDIATPGLDRPLLYPEHFACSINKWIEVRINATGNMPKRTIIGYLLRTDNENIEIKDEDDTIHLIRYNDIARGKWIYEYTPPSRKEA